MLKKMVFIMLTCSLTLAGCAAPIAVWSSNPSETQVENPYFQASISPRMDANGVFVMFHIEVTNKTDEILEIDWNESRYLFQGKIDCQLVFIGVDPNEAEQGNIPLEKIAPGETITKKVGPLRFTSFSSHRQKTGQSEQSRLSFGPLPAGYNGVQLVLRTTDKAVVEHLQVRLSKH